MVAREREGLVAPNNYQSLSEALACERARWLEDLIAARKQQRQLLPPVGAANYFVLLQPLSGAEGILV